MGEYRKNKPTFGGVSPARARPLPATLLPLLSAPGVGRLPRPTPGQGLARAGGCRAALASSHRPLALRAGGRATG